MQFLRATFAAYDQPVPPGGSNPPNPYNPVNAIYAAARYLCDSGARDGRDLYAAIFAYNRVGWYVRKVLVRAHEYRAAQADQSQARPWVVPARGQCSSGFGPRDGEFHAGQDIAAPIGTPIVAASAGRMIASGPASGYGLWVRIEDAEGVVSTYGHNNQNLVAPGQRVQAGHPTPRSVAAVNQAGRICISRWRQAAVRLIRSASTASARPGRYVAESHPVRAEPPSLDGGVSGYV